MNNLIIEIQDLMNVLNEDVFASNDYVKSNPSPFHKRMWCCSIFALIEGTTFQVRQACLKLNEMNPSFLGSTEKEELEKSERHLNTEDRIEHIFKAFTKGMGEKYDFDWGEDWIALKRFLLVHQRITHPRNSTDLEISDDELNDMECAFLWYVEQYLVFMKAYENALNPHSLDSITKHQTMYVITGFPNPKLNPDSPYIPPDYDTDPRSYGLPHLREPLSVSEEEFDARFRDKIRAFPNKDDALKFAYTCDQVMLLCSVYIKVDGKWEGSDEMCERMYEELG